MFTGTIAEFRGLTRDARVALHNRPLVASYFPFRIGRLSRTDLSASAAQDLLIPDTQPYHLSRKHLVLECESDHIRIRDEGSTCGTLVNDLLIGEKVGKTSSLLLGHGQHTIVLGGKGSPFAFQIDIRAMRPQDCPETQDLPDRLPQAKVLYAELCRQASQMLKARQLDPLQRSFAAEGLARLIVHRPELINVLQFLASNPLFSTEDPVAAHSVNVAIGSIVLFKHLDYPPDDIVRIAAATLLHDLGMYDIEPDLLRKSGALTPQERSVVKNHTTSGAELLRSDDEICKIAEAIASNHHERSDGSGYPRGTHYLHDISGFVGILDSFEAITHDRPHRKGLSPSQAVGMLVRDTAFDPDIRKTFVNAFTFFPVSSLVRLSTGEFGRVIRTNAGHPLSPEIKVVSGSDGRPLAEPCLIDLSREPQMSIISGIAAPR